MTSIFDWARWALLLALVISLHAPAFAQPAVKPQDYYAALGDTSAGNSLRTVEAYHMAPAVQQLRARQYQYAFGDIAFMLRYFPNHPRALDLLVQVCQEWRSPKCNPDEYFASALAINPNASGTFVMLGIYQLRYKQAKPAVDSLKRALELDPSSVNAHYNLGLAYFDLKQYALSNEHAQKAYELGAPLPGLKDKLRKVGQWNPGVRSAEADPPKPAPAPDTPPAAK